MKKLLILSLLLVSCGTIKKNIEEKEVKTEVDSSKSIKTETESEGTKETKINYKSSTFTFTPFDAMTPYFVDGKEYKGGTLVIKDESKDEFTIEQYKQKVFELSEEITRLKKEYSESKKDKETDNSKVYLYLFGFGFGFFALIILVILWWFSRKLNK